MTISAALHHYLQDVYISSFRGNESCAFEYDEMWLRKMAPAVSLDPELMPFPGRQYPVGKTMFGVFADAAPDRWGVSS